MLTLCKLETFTPESEAMHKRKNPMFFRRSRVANGLCVVSRYCTARNSGRGTRESDRMRIVILIGDAEELDEDDLKRMMQAKFRFRPWPADTKRCIPDT